MCFYEEGTKLVKHVLLWMKTNYMFCDENVRKAMITLILPFQQTVMKHEKKWKIYSDPVLLHNPKSI